MVHQQLRPGALLTERRRRACNEDRPRTCVRIWLRRWLVVGSPTCTAGGHHGLPSLLLGQALLVGGVVQSALSAFALARASNIPRSTLHIFARTDATTIAVAAVVLHACVFCAAPIHFSMASTCTGLTWSADGFQLAALDASSNLYLWWMRPERHQANQGMRLNLKQAVCRACPAHQHTGHTWLVMAPPCCSSPITLHCITQADGRPLASLLFQSWHSLRHHPC